MEKKENESLLQYQLRGIRQKKLRRFAIAVGILALMSVVIGIQWMIQERKSTGETGDPVLATLDRQLDSLIDMTRPGAKAVLIGEYQLVTEMTPAEKELAKAKYMLELYDGGDTEKIKEVQERYRKANESIHAQGTPDKKYMRSVRLRDRDTTFATIQKTSSDLRTSSLTPLFPIDEDLVRRMETEIQSEESDRQ